jgi:hypothetical protein
LAAPPAGVSGIEVVFMSDRRAWLRGFSAMIAAFAIGLGSICSAQQKADAIRPGEVWLDNRGVPIQAHGGGVILVGHEYYWFGEDRSPSNQRGSAYVACYSSKDLVHWRFRRQVLKLTDPEHLGNGTVLERPKVFFNGKTNTFVMYMHLDDAKYKLARVAIATSKKVDGNYIYVRSFRPLGQESRDIGQFVDDDGSAYLIFESRPTKGFFIAKLSDDYMDVAQQTSFIPLSLEGGAIVHFGGLYYVLGSHLSGWRPNPNVYATARSLSGPWTEFENIAPPETNTYSSQSTFLLKVVGAKTTTVIYLGDRWNPKDLPDSRYIWMPLQIGDGKMLLPEPQPWSIDVNTGKVRTVTPDQGR